MGCGCSSGAKKVQPVKITKKTVETGVNTNGRAASSVRRIIKRPSR